METRGQFTREEILSQPEAWAAALDGLRTQSTALRRLWQAHAYDQVILTGCGSTYYLALAAAALTQQLTGRPARGLPASELWLAPASSYPAKGRVLLVAISRSGETTETLRAGEAFEAAGRGDLVTLSCYPDMPLAQKGALNLVFPSGQERSVAQTRAFSTLYLGAVGLAAQWAGNESLLAELDRLPEAGRRLIEAYHPLAQTVGGDPQLERFYFLGSGPRYGLACELSLKMKEMSLSHSEPFHFMEFRHGPQSMVNAQTLLIGLVSEANRDYEMAVLDEMRARGAKVLAMSGHATEVVLAAGLSEAARSVLYLPVGQMVAFERALSRGLDPDRPHNLTAVVKLAEAL